MLDRLTRGIIILSLITLPQGYTSPSFAIERNKEDLKVTTKEEGYKNIQNQLEETKRLKAEQERLQKLKEEEEQKQREAEERKRIEEEKNSYNITFCLTHYGRSKSENGGYTKTCYGTELREGIIASNYWKRGTVIELTDGRRFIVEDTGSNNFNSPERLDVFIDTYDSNYLNKLGKQYIKGRIVKG